MKKSILVTSLALSISLLTACGGGSSSSTADTDDTGGSSTGGSSTGGSSTGGSSTGGGTTGGGTTGGSSTGGSSGSGVATTCSDTLSGGGRTITYKAGSDGDIEFDCRFPTSANPTGHEYSLKNGIPSLNIENVKRVFDIDYSCNNGTNFSGTANANYKTGVEIISGTFNGTPVSCTQTYNPVPFPRTISGNQSIEDLFENRFDSDNPVQSTCPNDINDEVDFETAICTGFLNSHYSVMDENNKTHKLSVEILLR